MHSTTCVNKVAMLCFFVCVCVCVEVEELFCRYLTVGVGDWLLCIGAILCVQFLHHVHGRSSH